MMNPNDGGARTEVGPHNTIRVAMEDLPEAEKIALAKELEEETAVARRRKLACFQKTRTRVIKKTTPAITTTATTAAASMVTPKMTPKELVKFMDIAVASKYGNDLSNLTRVITNDVHSMLESFKTDLQNALPRQIRSVVQQVQGEA
jgi:predicted GNAT family acetyltransferase